LSRLPVTDPNCVPFIEYAEHEKIPVLVHCGQWQEVASYSFVLELAERYQDVDFIMAHGGGNNSALRLEAPQRIQAMGSPDNVYLDLMGLGLWWAAEIAIDGLGAERFLFGSDFPLGHPKVLLGMIDALRISQDEKAIILGQNLERLLER
jgi:predicted TIM-barrel fold metal-dependent hydrolase